MEAAAEIAKRVQQSLPLPANTTAESLTQSSQSDCEVCGGDGWISVNRKVKACACQRKLLIERELPPLYRSARLSDLAPQIRERVSQWLQAPSKGLLISGGVGIGKTYIAAAIIRDLVEHGGKPLFRRMADLYAALRENYRVNGHEEEVLRPYFSAGLIVLDDLGAGGLTDFERRATLEVIERRLNWQRPTVVTTNWGLTEIAEKMDDRIASRLALYTDLPLKGTDRRLTAGPTGRPPSSAKNPAEATAASR
jgi:hypothetical protein